MVEGIDNPAIDERLGPQAQELREEVELVRGASHALDVDACLAATMTPVFFGSALNNFGVRELLEKFVELAPPPGSRTALVRERTLLGGRAFLGARSSRPQTEPALPPGPRTAGQRTVAPGEDRFSGFVFKIQANMDPQHRDRVAVHAHHLGALPPGIRIRHVRTGKDVQVANAITFMARDRGRVDDACAGDIIGLPNHGTIRIGDTFSQGEALKFTGIPSFAPELFRRVVLRDPLRLKALQKGLDQLSEEGATQVFRPLATTTSYWGRWACCSSTWSPGGCATSTGWRAATSRWT